MDAMIARVIAPAWLVLPLVRTPTAQVSLGVTEATRCPCAARHGHMPDLQAGWRNMESCIQWQHLVCSDYCFTVSQDHDGPKDSKVLDQHQSPIFMRFAFAVRSNDHLLSGPWLVVIADAQVAQSRRKPQDRCRSLGPTKSRVQWGDTVTSSLTRPTHWPAKSKGGQSSVGALSPPTWASSSNLLFY